MLMANAVQEVHLTLRPHTSGNTRYMYVNVVGILCCHDNNNNSNKVAGGSSKISTSYLCHLSQARHVTASLPLVVLSVT